MTSLRSAAAIAVLALAFGATPFASADSAAAPAACGATPPAVPEGQQLVERTLYFHGESASGDVDSYPSLANGTPGPLKLTPAPPTGTQPKVDTNASTTLYPAGLPGNMIHSAWHTYLDQSVTLACYGFDFFAVGDGGPMSTQIWPDAALILGSDVEPETSTATGSGAPVARYTSAAALKTPRLIDVEIFAQIEAETPATILYDSTDYPSKITLVTLEPLPAPTP